MLETISVYRKVRYIIFNQIIGHKFIPLMAYDVIKKPLYLKKGVVQMMLETTISKDNLSPYIAYQTVVKMINAKVTYNLVLSVSMSINGNLEFYRESPETIIKAIKQFAEINVKYSLKFHFKYDPNQTLVYQICLSITAALNNFSTHYQFLKTFNPTLRLFDTKDNTNTLIDSKYFTPQQVYSKLEYHFSNNPKHHLALIFSA